mmetsp:Transcript_21804/g.45437  ORF Transcript_21804/g.45437 Transcript_21804/m.45437 type:complete len:168 (+) Transcript_21804:245-748(+)
MPPPQPTNNRRLLREYQALLKSPSPSLHLLPSTPSNLLSWSALLPGPPDSPYSGYVFSLSLTCPSTYPLQPPVIKFVTPIFHPNIHLKTGEICLDVLKDNWSPAWSLSSSLRAISALLTDPVPDSPLNCDAGNMIREKDELAYNTTARYFAEIHARKVTKDGGGGDI